MGAKVSDQELFKRCYGATHYAGEILADGYQKHGGQLPADKVKLLRNTLREAFCAAQELKTRSKKLKAEMRKAEIK